MKSRFRLAYNTSLAPAVGMPSNTIAYYFDDNFYVKAGNNYYLNSIPTGEFPLIANTNMIGSGYFGGINDVMYYNVELTREEIVELQKRIDLKNSISLPGISYPLLSVPKETDETLVGAYFNVLSKNNIYSYLDNFESFSVVEAILQRGGDLTNEKSIAISEFITEGKSSGWWYKMVACYGIAGGTAESHAINWKTPGINDVEWVGTLTHNSLGVKSDGFTGYGKTPFIPLTLWNAQQGVHLASQTEALSSSGPSISHSIYQGNGSPRFYLHFLYDTTVRTCLAGGDQGTLYGYYCNFSSSYPASVVANRIGNIQRVSINGETLQKETITYNVDLQTSKLNLLKGDSQNFATANHGFFSIGYGLTDAQVISLSSAIKNLQVGLGR